MRGGVRVDGDVGGQMVVGDRNVVINATGSSVSVGTGAAPRMRARKRPARSEKPDPAGPLVGREEELADVARWLRQKRPVVVHGSRGAGKSALLCRVAADWDGDVVFLAAAGQPVEDVLQRLFETCYDVEDYRPTPARLGELMAPIRALFVIDDFPGRADDLTNLIQAVPAGSLLVGTTAPLGDGAAQRLELGGLAEEEALGLVTAKLGRDLDDEEFDGVRCVYEACHGQPGTMLQAAAAIEEGRGASLGTDLAFLREALVAGLNAQARAALDVLRALPGLPVPSGLLTALAGDDADVAELERVGLAVAGAGGHVLAAGAEGEADPADYAEALDAWARTATPREVASAGPIVLAVLTAAADRGDHERACRLARTTAPAFGRALRWGVWRQVLKLGHQSARRSDSAEDAAYFEQEDRVRRRALGMLAGLAAAGGAAGGTALAVHATAATGAKASGAAVLAHPAVIVVVVTVVATAGVAGVVAVRGGGRPVSAPAPAAVPSGVPTRVVSTRPPPSPSTSESRSRTPEPQGQMKVVAEPSTVEPGDMLTITATGFKPRQPIHFMGLDELDGGSGGIRHATTDGQGRAEKVIKVHAPSDGRYRVYVYDVLSHLTPDDWVEVKGPGRGTGREGVESTPPLTPPDISFNPPAPEADQTFTVIAIGFRPRESVRVTGLGADGVYVATDDGRVEAPGHVPSGPGQYDVTAVGLQSDRKAHERLTID
ncbi:hypothetical protein [Actinomadura rugatobispora]|uniref:ATP-binding protein n=1 Tax=Actinomadura rugatobispora TaxID=1994 RepID=A0ABW1A9F6_9ACTN|nr:hypothetical protein GCM10010200_018030 [Actinomadura rugatobispora]